MRPLRLLQASIFLFIGFVALAMVPRAQAGWNTQESTAATNSSFTFSYTNGSSPQIYYIRYSPNDGTTWYEAFGAAGPTLAGTVTFSSPGTWLIDANTTSGSSSSPGTRLGLLLTVTVTTPDTPPSVTGFGFSSGTYYAGQSVTLHGSATGPSGNLQSAHYWIANGASGAPSSYGSMTNAYEFDPASGGSYGATTSNGYTAPSAGTTMYAYFAVQDSAGGTSGYWSASITVSYNPISFSPSPTSFTYNGFPQGPGAGSSGGTYTTTWDSGVMPTNAGNYNVKFDGNGNYSGSSGWVAYTINQASNGTVGISGSTSVQAGGNITFTSSGGVTGNYSWGGSSGASGGSNSKNVTFPNVGNYTVTCQDTGDVNHSASNNASVTVTVTAIPQSAPTLSSITNGGNVEVGQTLTAVVAGTHTGYSGGWSGPGCGTPNLSGSTFTITPTSPGTYTYLVSSTAGGNYSASGNLSITFHVAAVPTGTISASIQNIMVGMSTTITQSSTIDTADGDGLGYTMIGTTTNVPGAAGWGGYASGIGPQNYIASTETSATSHSWVFTPASAGTYSFYNDVYPSDTTVWMCAQGTNVNVCAVPTGTVNGTSLNLYVGQSTTITATTAFDDSHGGSSGNDYTFIQIDGVGDFNEVQGLSTSYTWTPTAPGSYTIRSLAYTYDVTGGSGWITVGTATIRVAAQPTSTITAGSTSLVFGQSTNVTASYTVDTADGDALTGTIIGVSAAVPGSTGGWNVQPYYVQDSGANPNVYSYTPTVVGSVTFYADSWTNLVAYWTNFGPAGGVTVATSKATPSGSYTGGTRTPQSGLSYTVQSADLNATFSNPNNGGAPFAPTSTPTYTISPLSPNGVSGSTVTAGSTVFTGGLTYIIRATYPADTNFVSAPVDATFTINKGAQTITFGALSSVTYGVSPITLTATASSGLGVSYGVSGPGSVSGSTLTVTGAGSIVITASQTGNGNWGAATPVPETLTVAKASLTITASNASKSYGAANPAFSYTPSGFVNGDSSAVLSGSPSLTTTATVSSVVGTYPITAAAGTLSAANYSFVFAAGTLTVNKTNTTVTVGYSDASAISNKFVGDAITLTGSVLSSTDGSTVTSPVFTIQSISYISGPAYSAGATVTSGFAIGGIVTNSDGSTDVGAASGGIVVILASYAGDANHQASSSTTTITPLQNASYPSNVRAIALAPSNRQAWLTSSPVTQDTFTVLRAR